MVFGERDVEEDGDGSLSPEVRGGGGEVNESVNGGLLEFRAETRLVGGRIGNKGVRL